MVDRFLSPRTNSKAEMQKRIETLTTDSRTPHESLVPQLMSYWFDDPLDSMPHIGLLRAASYFIWKAASNDGIGDGQRFVVDIKGRSAIIQDIEPPTLHQMRIRRALDKLMQELGDTDGTTM